MEWGGGGGGGGVETVAPECSEVKAKLEGKLFFFLGGGGHCLWSMASPPPPPQASKLCSEYSSGTG